MALSFSRRALSVALFAIALRPGSADAKGRFARLEHVFESPVSSDRLVVTASFGLLTTPDRGATWAHTCPTAFAFSYFAGDPIVSIGADESLLVGHQSGISISSDHGCDFRETLSFALEDPTAVVAMARAPSSADTVFAVLQSYTDGGASNWL